MNLPSWLEPVLVLASFRFSPQSHPKTKLKSTSSRQSRVRQSGFLDLGGCRDTSTSPPHPRKGINCRPLLGTNLSSDDCERGSGSEHANQTQVSSAISV